MTSELNKRRNGRREGRRIRNIKKGSRQERTMGERVYVRESECGCVSGCVYEGVCEV